MDCITGQEHHFSKPVELDFDDPEKYFKLEMKSYMTPKYLFEECKKLFKCYIFDKKYMDNIMSNRKGEYTVYFKNTIEADEENKNLSADELNEMGVKGITLEERLLLEIEYFKKTGNHLDIKNWTLCSGSRDSYGLVPRSRLYGDSGFGVYWNDPDFASDFLRARSAVKIIK